MEIYNAAPMVKDLGTQDLSTRQVALNSLSIPQHLPKFWIFSSKGKAGPSYVDLGTASLTQLYGDDTFDVNGKYFNHATPFVQTTASNGNNMVIHRLVPDDAKDVANVAVYVDYIATQVPIYQKNTDGSLVLNDQGEPLPVLDGSSQPLTVAGYNICFVVDFVEKPYGEYQPGVLVERNGIQSINGVQSKQLPILEAAARDFGSDGKRLALRLFPALKTDMVPFPTNMLTSGKQYPYSFGLTRIVDDVTGKVAPILNRFGAQVSTVTLKRNGVDPSSGAIISLEKVAKDSYINLPDNLATGLGHLVQYSNNIETLANLFYAAESIVSDQHRDPEINNSAANQAALNLIGLTSSNGSPYQALKLVDIPGSIRITRNTNLFMDGGSDGTMNDAVMDALVAQDLENYNDSLHEYNDLVMHPESIIYDSGFAISTKLKFPKFISRRKDTFMALGTYAHNAPAASLEDQYSVAVSMKTMVEMYPESAFFGTPVMRGIVLAGSGILNDNLYVKRVPTTIELLDKASKYMGAANGAWKNGFLFDRAPGSILTMLKDIDVTWVPTSTREVLWSAGINFVLNYSTRSQFFPSMQTVYDNDTSILNSVFSAMAISYLNKVEHAAWREYSGVMSMTEAQLTSAVNGFVEEAVQGKFDNLFVIIPDAKVTEQDSVRGYSWTLNIKFGANNSRTVMTAMVSAYRMSDLVAA